MADPAEKVQYDVYLGAWINWSRGRILGATLTLEPRYGLLLLSFTATFVGFVASRFWHTITLILHRIYSTPEPRDALHHQRQVILRNSLSAPSTLWTSLQLAWCWRAIADGYLARILPTIIAAVSAFCAFTVAGGFTSSISSGISNDVLINGSRCALLGEVVKTSDVLTVMYPWLSQTMNNAANYAQQCYSFNSTGTLDCTTFVKSHLEFDSVLNASCPFSDNMCRSNDSNILLDTGLISSEDFGLNIPSSQRMFYREVLHCAPLRTKGFVSDVSTEYAYYTRYSYGSGVSSNSSWTYEAESLYSKYSRLIDNPIPTNTKGFNLVAMVSRIMNGTVWEDASDFVSIPELTVPDGDSLVIFLSPEGILFLNQTDDPWYRATVLALKYQTSPDSPKSAMYIPDEAASPMGCVLRQQYCNANKECGSLASPADAEASALHLFHLTTSDVWAWPNSSQSRDASASRFMLFQPTLQSASNLRDILLALGSSSLLSPQHLGMGLMGPLPDNQWQLDVIHWLTIRMAAMQASFVTTAHGPTDEAVLPYMFLPDNVYQQDLCNNQKILSANFTSLSLFGLCFTYATGIVVILVSYTAEPLLAFFYSRCKYEEYKYLEWTANGTLQLQRLAYQGLGSEKWTDYTDDIPKTRAGYFLADLARAYPPEDDNDEVQEMKPTVHAASTTTPSSISETSTNRGVAEQFRGAPAHPASAAPGPIPQSVPPMWQAVPPSPQPVSPSAHATMLMPSLQAVLPNPQAVSPISQPGAALGNQDPHSSLNIACFAGQPQNSPRDGRQGERSVAPLDRMAGYF